MCVYTYIHTYIHTFTPPLQSSVETYKRGKRDLGKETCSPPLQSLVETVDSSKQRSCQLSVVDWT